MAAPVITSAMLNKAAYAKGETMILTVVGSDADEATFELTVTLRNTASGAESAPVKVSATVDELTVSATDSAGRVWTLTSRVGSTWTLTAVA